MVAGGGLAGAAAACRLAQAGRRVVLLEREKAAAHKICGEFISGEALAELAALGVDLAALGAVPITAMRLVHRGRVAESRLPFPAASLSRLALDEALLCRAAALGAELHRGVRVRKAEPGRLQTDRGACRRPRCCWRRASTMCAACRARRMTPPDDLIGFKLHLHLRPAQRAALAGHVEIVLFDGGYAGLQMVEGGVANLCLLVDRSRYDADWPALLAALEREDSHLARRLDGARPAWARPLTIFRVPYGFVHRGRSSPACSGWATRRPSSPPSAATAWRSPCTAPGSLPERCWRGRMPPHITARSGAMPGRRCGWPSAPTGWTRSPAIRSLVVAAARRWPA